MMRHVPHSGLSLQMMIIVSPYQKAIASMTMNVTNDAMPISSIMSSMIQAIMLPPLPMFLQNQPFPDSYQIRALPHHQDLTTSKPHQIR